MSLAYHTYGDAMSKDRNMQCINEVSKRLNTQGNVNKTLKVLCLITITIHVKIKNKI